ncbi:MULTISPECIES: PTS sugar transporter subunit IIB [Bacillaceae]|uniref:PTS galactitol transporter subunit IIB n=1 Tax=Oceanobacillus caeni TaxID=405946 RepID=A0ABR5MMN4_9BACI|nr:MULTISPECIES: PTS sugar transporter subunit IIB [Bacillaceae]KPH78185.1 PTS galactitol transporter subunit IIB [Oceanobacillus caeni]
MKRGLIVCGTGIATSTIVIEKLKRWLKTKGLNDQIELHQGKISESLTKQNDYDFIVSTTIVPDEMTDTVINGVPLLTGIEENVVYEQIKNIIG